MQDTLGRQTFLVGVGTTAVLAGCVSGDGDDNAQTVGDAMVTVLEPTYLSRPAARGTGTVVGDIAVVG